MTQKPQKKAKIEALDLLSSLPDEILLTILSPLPIDEVVRTSILSKRWVSLWKYTPHLNIDVKHMIKPFTQLGISSPAAQLHYILSLPKQEGINRHNILVYLLLHHHLADVETLKFTHFPQIDINTSIEFMLERKKTIETLTLECRPLDDDGEESSKRQRFLGMYSQGIFSSLYSLEVVNYFITSSMPFEGCEYKLRSLRLKMVEVEDDTINGILRSCLVLESLSLEGCTKLKEVEIVHQRLRVLELRALRVKLIVVCCHRLEVLVFASLVCHAERIVVNARRLKEFRSHCNPISPKVLLVSRGKSVLKTQDILESLADYSGLPRANIFRHNLSSLIIDLDLNNKRAAQALLLALTSCVNLQNLEITAPVYSRGSKVTSERSDDNGVDHKNEAGNTNYNPPLLWEKSEMCECIEKKLKYVSIVGFTGKEGEAEFVKHLIRKAANIHKITILCKSSKKEAACLLPLLQQHQTASLNLSLMVRPAKNAPLIPLHQLLKNKF